MKILLAGVAVVIAVGGMLNFFASFNDSNPISIGITHPLAMAAMAYLLFRHIFPAFLYRAPAAAVARAVQEVRASGSLLAATRCGGSVGWLNARGPLIRAEVYPGGLVIKMIMLAPFAILKHEIAAIEAKKVFLGTIIEIRHLSAQAASPIQLACGGDTAFYAALDTLMGAPVGVAA
jgi:hypothetical protein